MKSPLELKTLLGDYPITQAIKSGAIASPTLRLDFAAVKSPATAFKRVVRDMEFDVAELAIVTFLLAKAHGKPLTLLPAVIFGRFQHPYLMYNADHGPLAPSDLAGRRIGIRSFSVTTATWLRGILADDYGVDLSHVKWVTFEEPHVAEFRDPPSVTRAPEGKTLVRMLLDGEVDAAIMGDSVPPDPRIRTVIADPAAAAADWRKKHGAIQINHMVAVRDSISRDHPEAVRELWRMLVESRKAANLSPEAQTDINPFGLEANRRNLEAAIDCVWRQGMIPRRYSVDELFDDVTRSLVM